MKRFTLSVLTALIVLMLPAPGLQGQVTFPGPELLGRPTSSSITVDVVPSAAIDAYVEYGTQPGQYTHQTAIASAPANEPLRVVINGLEPNTHYYYRMVYRPTGTTTWTMRDEHAFQTQRAPGSTFTFTVMSDSHVNILLGNANLYTRALQNAAADNPDFHLDLGDTFAMDNVTTQAQANTSYLSQRSYLGLVSHSAPIFLVLGNHEQEEGWHLDDTGNLLTSQPVMGANARKRYFLNPGPNDFYSGNTDTLSAISGDGLRGDYYAWEWGDALFVAIDPFWYTTVKPFTGNTGGGEGSDAGSGDRWDWTLGWDQYQWLKRTLENSHATYKFVFAHHVTGGTENYVRGGANAVPYCEWGGYNVNGTTWGFDTRRPGWYAPVHQLLTENHVTAFFHGHDHEFAYEKRDGVVYQEVPMPSDTGYGYGFNLYRETDPYTIRVLPNSGHLRVSVSPSGVVVDYVRAFLSGAGTNGQVAYTYTMTGTGGGTGPAAVLAPTSVAFGNQAVGVASAAQTVSLTNSGDAPLEIAGIAVTGTNSSDFAQSNTCGTSVAPGGTCTISVTFTPTTSGSRTASIAISDNAAGNPHAVALTGTGVAAAPAVTLSPTSLSFGNQAVGTTSTARTVTLTNSGTGALAITGITVTGTNAGDFAYTNTCGTTVGAGAACTLGVTFKPTAAGSRTASISISDDAAGSPHKVTLSGTGTTSAPAVTLSPTSLTFGNQAVGTTSSARTVTLTNSGRASLAIAGIAVTGTNSGDYTQTSTCGTSLAAGARCTISVRFKPTATGSRTASLSISDNAAGSPHGVGLSGTGVASAPAVTLSPTSLAFGNQTVGTTSAARTVTVTNSGGASLTIASITVAGTNGSDFTQTTTCTTSLAAGAKCTISVTFKPTATGARTASVSISDNAAGSPHVVGLTGSGVVGGAVLTMTPSPLSFGSQAVGTTGAPVSLTLTNSGGAALTFSDAAMTGANTADFIWVGDNCPTSLAAGASCQLTMTFRPSGAGGRTASLIVYSNATNSPTTVALTGAGQ